jgi:hypothetical protein
MVEASLGGKPLIVTLFEEASQPEYADFVPLYNGMGAFDVARSAAEFRRMIIEKLDAGSLVQKILAHREALFDKPPVGTWKVVVSDHVAHRASAAR